MRLQQMAATTETVRRYDADTVRQVLARASELEQEEQDRLSAVQVEALGREIGLSPEAVRRALGEIEHRTGNVQQLQQLRPLRSRAVIDSAMPGLMYAIALSFFVFYVSSNHSSSVPDPLILVIAFCIPPLIALVNSWRQRSLLLGLIGGVATTLSALLAICIGATLGSHNPAFGSELGMILGAAVLIGLIAALIGDFGRRQFESWQAKHYKARER